jgi:hypothetical protein
MRRSRLPRIVSTTEPNRAGIKPWTPRREQRSQLQKQGVQHQQEKAERQKRDGEEQKLQNHADGSIDEGDDDSGRQGRAEAPNRDARNDLCDNPQRQGAGQPTGNNTY